MLPQVLEKTPCHSSHESPFLSYLQPCSSVITSWKHQRENVSTVNLYDTPPAKLGLCGIGLRPPTSHHPPPTCQFRSLWQIQSVFYLALYISQINS
ncbi:hypothetical protein ATANTOWER_026665 [Ataeniobius toweri]|uniref:Uncharacterized protein n=1 Tax=Ataeniobius toweri TaxID=208326 RepID=A0ABU7C9K5_9TELE|nr:hypothetical protein [Ataeniobius toweri]